MARMNMEYDYIFDWTLTEAPKRHSIYPGQAPGQRIAFTIHRKQRLNTINAREITYNRCR